MATPGTLPMDGKSSGRKLVTTPAEARAAGDPAHNRQQVGAHGLDAIKDILLAPLPIAISATTEATPMIIPSMVSMVHIRKTPLA